MQISWLPQSQNGPMLADYLSSSYVNDKAFGVFMVAKAPSGGVFNEAAYTTKNPLEASADEPRFSSKGEKRIPGVHADRPFPRNQGEERDLQPRLHRSSSGVSFHIAGTNVPAMFFSIMLHGYCGLSCGIKKRHLHNLCGHLLPDGFNGDFYLQSSVELGM